MDYAFKLHCSHFKDICPCVTHACETVNCTQVLIAEIAWTCRGASSDGRWHISVCMGHVGGRTPAAAPLSASEDGDLCCIEPLGRARLCSSPSHAVRLSGRSCQGVHACNCCCFLARIAAMLVWGRDHAACTAILCQSVHCALLSVVSTSLSN